MSTSKISNEHRTEVSEIDHGDNSRNYFNVQYVLNEIFSFSNKHLNKVLSNL